MISAILAISKNNCIGKDNKLPWPYIKEDMSWFQDKTKDNIVVMGSNTWDSLDIHKPLKNRRNIVISSKKSKDFPGADSVINHDILSNILNLSRSNPTKEVFIIGGAQIYTLCAPITDTWYITRIDQEYDGDTFFDLNKLIKDFSLVSSVETADNPSNLPRYWFEIYKK